MGAEMVTVVKKEPAEGQAEGSTPEAVQTGAGMADLMQEAQALEASAAPLQPGSPGGPAAVISDNLEAEVLSALQMARVAAGQAVPWWPEYREVWSDQTLQSIAAAGAEVMRRHGWNMGELLGKWGPYIALVGAIAPPAMVTYQVVKERREQAAAAARAKAEGGPDGGAGQA
jgi:hypothetical protein